jgi:DNA (cytosine-5)-methyltransferase 1
MLKVLDLFSGIVGFSLGLERTGGFQTVAFCEIEPYCRRVLAKHWPDVRQYEDVRELTAERLAADGIAVDVITGGFPCQDISTAGKRAGMDEGTRSGLWSEIVRLARDLRPRFIIVENVSNLLSGPSERPGGWFGRVLGDLAEIRFDAEWHCIPASAVGAPHIRDRVWIIAYPQHPHADSAGPHRAQEHVNGDVEPPHEQVRFVGPLGALLADAKKLQCNGRADHARGGGQGADALPESRDGDRFAGASGSEWLCEPEVGRVVDGIPGDVDCRRLIALGNAVVPAIPEIIGRAILTAEAA